MKILYVKSNSEREKKYQLQTVIYEENGKKFVKKKALCREAIPHLKRMKDEQHSLADTIVASNVHLAPIVEEGADYLTFAFIHGTSIEKRLLLALKKRDTDDFMQTIEKYRKLLIEGFETDTMIPEGLKLPDGRKVFEGIDFARLGKTRCFVKTSNIDLIFSNILLHDNHYHLIDYEWVYEGSVPVNFALFRALRSLHDCPETESEHFFDPDELTLYLAMEKRLIQFEIMSANSFYQYRKRYEQKRENLYEHIASLQEEIRQLHRTVEEKNAHIADQDKMINILKEETVFYASSKSWKITRPMRKSMQILKGKQ